MKTLKEFDYDLWATVENGCKRYFARVKATGEETEVSLDVMRLLLSQEKQMRREINARKNGNGDLMLDVLPDDDTGESWLIDNYQNVEDKVISERLEQEFISTLTDKQRRVYVNCMKPHKTVRAYAEEIGMSFIAVQKAIEGIRKKFKKFLN